MMVFVSPILAIAENPDTTQIRLWTCANVSETPITLGQIATITGNSETVTALKSIPVSIETSTLRAWQLAQQIADAGFDVSRITLTGAARCRINRVTGSLHENASNDPTVSIHAGPKRSAVTSLKAQIRKRIVKMLVRKGLPEDYRLTINFNPIVRDLLAGLELDDRRKLFLLDGRQLGEPHEGLIARNPDHHRVTGHLVPAHERLDRLGQEVGEFFASATAHAPAIIDKNAINAIARQRKGCFYA